MRNIAFIVFFKAGFQVFGTADIEMGSGGFINEYVYVVEVGHQRKSFRITFVVVRCRVTRLHLLRRLRRGSLPLAVFVLRTSPCQACSLVCATGLPRRNLGFAEMKTCGAKLNSSETISYAQVCCTDCKGTRTFDFFGKHLRKHKNPNRERLLPQTKCLFIPQK